MMHEIAQLKVVYLAGTSYCGSTLLAFLLNAHPQVVSLGEASLHRRGQQQHPLTYRCSCGAFLVHCAFWSAVFRRVQERGLHFSAHNWTNDYKYHNALLQKLFTIYAARPWLSAFQHLTLRRLPFHKNRVAYANKVNLAFIQAALQLTGTEVFFDTSKALLRLAYLQQLPELDLKVVRVVRDVRAFAHSYKRRGVAVAQAARQWRNYQVAAEALLQPLPSDRVLLLRYEDFCQAPRQWLRQLHTFCGVPPRDPPETLRPSEHHIIGNHMRLQTMTAITANDSWREHLTGAETTRILHLAGDINAHLGYPPHRQDPRPGPPGGTGVLPARASAPVSG
jgi:Sulfotransferase domain